MSQKRGKRWKDCKRLAIFDVEVEILMSLAERALLAKYILKSDGNIVELGTFAGGSATIIARLKGDRSLTCVDNFSGFRHNYEEVRSYLSQFANLKLIPLSTQEVSWGSNIGLLLIDACHHNRSYFCRALF